MPRPRRVPKKVLEKSFRDQVELAQATPEDKNPRWIQIARTGLWKGYRVGRTLEFTVETFTTLVDNFRKHPSYKAGADGKGSTDVIPFDFNHASEMDPAEGDLPVVG